MASSRSSSSPSRAASGWDYIAVGLIVGLVFGVLAVAFNGLGHFGFNGWLAFVTGFTLGFCLGPRVWL